MAALDSPTLLRSTGWRALALGILVAVGAAGCERSPEVALELAPCTEPPFTEELLCGRLPVPESRAATSGRRIELAVVVAPAAEPSDAAPMFVLEGGPGIAATGGAPFFLREGAAYRERRDVVMVDLRGTGGSNPLHCPSLEGRDVPLQRHLQEMYPPEEVAACRRRLEGSASLAEYTTQNAVADLEEVRRALGAERIVLYGISYGTRLAQEYLRRHPERVESFVGIGTIAPDHRMPLRHAEGFQRAFDLLLDDCAADASCGAAYPDLRSRWLALLTELEQGKTVLHAPEPGAPAVELEIGRDVFVSELRSALYFASAGRGIPAVVDAASRGDFGPFLALALPSGPPTGPGLAEGLYLSITCAEDVPRIAEDEIASRTAGTYLGDYRVVQQRRACAEWTAGSPPADWGEPVASSVPALLVTGDRDPVTPPSDAAAAAVAMPNARVLVVPHAGHLPFDGSDPLCVDGLVLQFLESGSAAEVDASCLDALVPLPFDAG